MNELKCELKRGEIDVDDEKVHTVLGGDPSSPSWEYYLEDFKEEYKPHIQAIKKCIEEGGLIGSTGSEMANDYHFKLSDGHIFCFTWRGWGDLMQAIVDKQEGYIKYYM